MTTPDTRPWHDTVPPHPDALLYRPIDPVHPVGPGGQLARRPSGSWWYRELAVISGARETLPDLLRVDLAHAMRRRDELMVDADGAAGDGDFTEADRLAELHGILGTPEVIDLSAALQEAGTRWRERRSTKTVESLAEWIEAPDDLARIAESLRTEGV
ncbi:hypothetical protein ACFXOL_11035 [Streptomyces californicus]|uniref:hypothetical protein n=1 Tax=Streptomyces californicus TaxID=67351 RepID=UPI003668585B